MTLRPRTALAIVALLFTLAACEPNRFVSGWVPYWGATAGRAGFSDANASTLFSEVSPFWFSATSATTISQVGTESDLTATINAARRAGLPVLPSMTDGTGKLVMAGILADPAQRAVHVQAIVNLVAARGFDGIDLDYEGFAFTDGKASWPTTQPNWVAFVSELGVALHDRGKLLSVTIPPTWGTTSPPSGYWVYDQQAIAGATDRIRLMVYDFSVGSPGPIAPMSWVNQVITYSGARVPPSKLQLGVPAYGRHWATKQVSSETCPDGALSTKSVQMNAAPALAASRGLTPTRNTTYGEMTFGWAEKVTGPRGAPIPPPILVPPSNQIPSIMGAADPTGLQPAQRLKPLSIVTCTVQHTVYYPDAESIRQRAAAALGAGWSGIVIWALGYESADVFDALGSISKQRPGGSPSLTLDSNPPAVTGTSVRVTGWAVDPEFDLPVAVRITVGAFDSTVLARLDRPDVAAALPGVGPFHGFDQNITLAPGSYTLCITVKGWVGQPDSAPACQPVTIGPL